MITSLEELQELAKVKLNELNSYNEEVKVCCGSSCEALGATELTKNIKKRVKEAKKDTCCNVKPVGCNGLCAAGILVSHSNKEKNSDILYENIELEDEDKLIDGILNEKDYEEKKCDTTRDFFKKQEKIVLANAGNINPDDINDYIAYGGYLSLFTALTEMMPNEVIEEVKISGLRGRGGGGYPAGIKWETVAKVERDQKYVVCNGDEGDPGAFMDRAIMEADPHRLIEGMALAAYAVGANKGYIYVRAEYPIAVEKLNKAIKQAKANGILGQQIAGSNFNFELEVRLGGGAFVCGEATALITSIEGNRGNPRQKPPHLSDYGLFQEPTVLNNVETYANIAPIVLNGGEWFRGFGTENSPGTKVFALTGHINNTGLVEVPMGMTLQEIIYDIGGGIPKGKKLKAVQTGGPSGGCIPANMMDLKVDYDSLKEVGSMMGSGGMIVTDDTSNMVEVAHFFMDFCKSESCGKCVPCRVGTTEMTNILKKFVDKQATQKDFDKLVEICEVVKDGSLCGLGQTAPNPVLSTIRYFKNEYLEAIKHD